MSESRVKSRAKFLIHKWNGSSYRTKPRCAAAFNALVNEFYRRNGCANKLTKDPIMVENRANFVPLMILLLVVIIDSLVTDCSVLNTRFFIFTVSRVGAVKSAHHINPSRFVIMFLQRIIKRLLTFIFAIKRAYLSNFTIYIT